MYAIIETGGKQYKVQSGDTIDVEKLNIAGGESVEFDALMTVGEDGKAVFGGKVKAEAVGNFKAKKIVVYKFKAKKNMRKKTGHRQTHTRLKISTIVV